MKAQARYVRRTGIIELTDKAEPIPEPLLPEKVLLNLLQNGRKFDVGALCYKRVKKSRVGKNQGFVKEVDESSLDKCRREPIKRLLDFVKAGGSKKHNYNVLGGVAAFQNWIDENEPSLVEINNPDVAKRMYVGFTQHLIHRLHLPDIPKNRKTKIGNNSASMLQSYALIWVHCLSEVSENDIQYWAPKITQNSRVRSIPQVGPTIDDCNRSMAALVGIIDAAWKSLVRDEQDQVDLAGETVPVRTQGERDKFLRKVLAISAMSFMGATGANQDVALTLKTGQGEVVPARKGMKYTGIKYRANGKEVYLEFGAFYLKYWKKYLELRDLILRNDQSDLLFPYRDQSGNIMPLKIARLYENGSSTSIPAWFESVTGEKWINASKWRSHRDLQINSVNGNDLADTAQMQDRSLAVTLQNYQNRDLSVAAEEISSALNLIYEAAIKRTRTQEAIHVRLVDEFKKSREIPTGQCASGESLTPQLATGFTDLNPVIPDCKTKEGCIFCEFYSVHADETDLRKLLSLRFLCEELKQCMPHDQFVYSWSPVIYRVDEIIKEILSAQPHIESNYRRIESEVELGELDDYWSRRVDILLNLGVIA